MIDITAVPTNWIMLSKPSLQKEEEEEVLQQCVLSKPDSTKPGPTTPVWTCQSGFRIQATPEQAINLYNVETLFKEDSFSN